MHYSKRDFLLRLISELTIELNLKKIELSMSGLPYKLHSTRNVVALIPFPDHQMTMWKIRKI